MSRSSSSSECWLPLGTGQRGRPGPCPRCQCAHASAADASASCGGWARSEGGVANTANDAELLGVSPMHVQGTCVRRRER